MSICISSSPNFEVSEPSINPIQVECKDERSSRESRRVRREVERSKQ